MDKQSYLQSRSQNQIDINLAWELYINTPHSSPKIDQQLFNQLFPVYCSLPWANFDGYFQYFDEKFEVRKVVGLNGEISYL